MISETKKSPYEVPIVELVEFDALDVITTSGGTDSGDGSWSGNNGYIDPSGWT